MWQLTNGRNDWENDMEVYICGELIPLPLIIIGIIGLIYLGFAIWYAIAMSRLWKK